jgi:hypothetical protein
MTVDELLGGAVPRFGRAVLTGLFVLAVPPLATAATWTRVGSAGSLINEPSVASDGSAPVVAWALTPGGSALESIEASTLTVSSTGAVTPSPAVTAVGGWAGVSNPLLVSRPGGLQLIWQGSHSTDTNDPLPAGTYVTARDAAGGFGPPAAAGRPYDGDLGGVGLPDGTPLWATNFRGTMSVLRGVVPTQEGNDLQAGLGCCAYHPNMAFDASGRLWAAWYSQATGHLGILVQQVDPATGLGVGAPALAPGSAPTQNSSQTRIALACAPAPGGCRVAYLTQGAAEGGQHLVTWAPGEAAPTDTGLAAGSAAGANGSVTAAYRADGRLWIAWRGDGTIENRLDFFATLGDARGAGGAPIPLGAPPPSTSASVPLESLAVGSNLLVVTLAGDSGPAVYATGVQPVNFAVPDTSGIPNPGVVRNGKALLVAPKRISVRAIRRGKCVPVRVQAQEPSRVYVAIFSGPKSERRFGATVVRFKTAGARKVCVKVPLRAHTFDIRQRFRVGLAVKPGFTPKRGEPRSARVKTQPLAFFK